MFVREIVCCLAALAVFPGLSCISGADAVFARPADSATGAYALSDTDKALLDIRNNMALSRQRAALLADEVKTLKQDRKNLTQALVKAAGAERAYAQDIRVSEGRLKMLLEKKHTLETVLAQRRAEFAQVLAGLERMGLNPPPAIFVHSDDALQSVRSAVVLGSVVPRMKARTDTLVTDLKELDKTAKAVRVERLRLAAAVENQQAEKKRLSLLMAEKARLQKESEENLAAEKEHSRQLAEKARSLQELLVELQRQPQDKADAGEGSRLLRIQTDFASLHGLLPLPVDGQRVQAFGKSSQGEVIETEPGAVVISPMEGIVRYAGPFRSYGQLLIIDAGRNYHLILAGLGRIDVAQGQMLLQGEPVGVMGARLVASAAAFDVGKNPSMLYIEIRKDGKPVNPASWWARR